MNEVLLWRAVLDQAYCDALAPLIGNGRYTRELERVKNNVRGWLSTEDFEVACEYADLPVTKVRKVIQEALEQTHV